MKTLFKRKRKQGKGFTIVEVMMSIMILGFSSITILAMSSMATKMSKQNEIRSTVQSIARSQIDRIIAVSQQNRVVVTNQAITLDTDLRAQLPSTNLSATYSIRPVAGSKNLQSVEIVVRWQNQAGTSNSAMSTVTVGKTFSSVINADWTQDPWNPQPIDQLFYTPPPPPPPPPATSGSTGGTSTSGGSTGGSTSGGDSGGSSTTGGSTGGTTTTGSTTPPSPPPPTGFNLGGGNKWK